MLRLLVFVAALVLVFAVADVAMTYRALPASVAYSFGIRGEAKRWGSRWAVALGAVGIFASIFAGVLYAALASPAEGKTVAILTCLLVYAAYIQHAAFGATLSGRNRIPAFQYWSVGIALIVSVFALKHFIS